ncbi:C-C chemokine receptor type 10 [Sparus aurata]|uniref:Chemokine (C-C motif) receptor 10 n=1 Tax=Sparus aurata TaxID=8175 RepID=A0A671XQ28_SPAAU|nr:C-C chemokine receptor type 7-like [Sparus aurata]
MLNISNSSAMATSSYDNESAYIDSYDNESAYIDSYDNESAYIDGYDYNYSLWNISNGTDEDYLNSGWCEAGEQESTIKTFQACVFCIIFLLGVVGNCLVIATFALYGWVRLRSMTDVFLFHLALADLLLILTLPVQAAETHLGWIFTVPLCKVTRACYAINTYSGLLLLACISVDRYLVVARAQEMLRLRSRILTGGTVAALGVWLVAVLLSLPEILFSGVSGSGAQAYCGMQNSGKVKMATNGAIIGIFCLSVLVMVTCYSLIARVLSGGQTHRRGKQWHRQRTLKLMVALVLVFVVFQLPYTVVLSRKMAGQFCSLLLQYITCTLAYTRCCLNPILYALVGVRFRNDVLRLVHDSSCPCGLLLPQSVSSISPSSPAVTVLSACSPTSNERSYFGSETVSTNKFQFPINHS